ncbi:MAG: DUF3866 family protein [Bacillota bacterium]
MYQVLTGKALVTEILYSRPGLTRVRLDINGEQARAINFDRLTGKIDIGHRVVINRTAVALELGTGGYHFVQYNLDNSFDAEQALQPGHIIKLRYTPAQLKTLCVEEEYSPYHHLVKDYEELEGLPVLIIPLHSLLAPVTIACKYHCPQKNIVYIMTEGGGLPLDFSDSAFRLQNRGLLDSTITAGHSFGGELEAVNFFSGLIAARQVLGADIVIAGMGPGIVGTGTDLGYSGADNAFLAYAVKTLKGRPIIIPRLGFADERPRHQCISHHTITLLERLITDRAEVVFPAERRVLNRLLETAIPEKHDCFYYPYADSLKILKQSQYPFYSMGRDLETAPFLFVTGALAGLRVKEIFEE